MKKKIVFVIIIVLAILAAGGIYYWIQYQSQPTKIIFGAAQKLSPDGFSTQIIKLYGIDKKYGLDIDFAYNEPGLTSTKLLNRELDVAILAPISAAKANLDGKKVKIFGPLLWNVISLAVPKDSPYTNLAQLKGKKFGILPQITGTYTNMALLSSEMGLRLESDYKLVIGSLEDQVKFLANGDVDFAVVYEPRTSMLLATGQIREIATMDELWKQLTGQRFLFNGFAAYDDWLASHQKEAKALVKVFLEANKFITENPDLIVKHKDLLGLTTPQELDIAQKRIPNLFPTEWNQAQIENFNTLIKMAVDAGQVAKIPAEPVAIIVN
jgi:NitT/TauT family transport system substrate-binding protein